jgi:nicotinate-nucleotide adenylyltransferase
LGYLEALLIQAHDGHMHVASCGLRELALDRVWWITSKQNPLKNKQTEYDKRADSIKSLGLKKRMEINHIERKMNIQYSIQMIKALKVRSPNTKFIFLMGADNLSQFNKWKSWKEITLLVPIAVIARPWLRLEISTFSNRTLFERSSSARTQSTYS